MGFISVGSDWMGYAALSRYLMVQTTNWIFMKRGKLKKIFSAIVGNQ